jgi:hypothetical protein
MIRLFCCSTALLGVTVQIERAEYARMRATNEYTAVKAVESQMGFDCTMLTAYMSNAKVCQYFTATLQHIRCGQY